MRAQPQFWRKWQISRDPKELADPANAPYVCELKNGDRFIDWSNPNRSLEQWGERYAKKARLLASGDHEAILEHYAREHYSSVVKRNRLGPDYAETGSSSAPQPGIIPFPERKKPHEDTLMLMRLLRQDIEMLESQKWLLAKSAALVGCPAGCNPDCPHKSPEQRGGKSENCVSCWATASERKFSSGNAAGEPEKLEDRLWAAVRDMRQKIVDLGKQKAWLAKMSAKAGCPATGECPENERNGKDRCLDECAQCWTRYADKRIAAHISLRVILF